MRSFAPGFGLAEDPVCGSGHAAVAIHVARHLFPERIRFAYRAEQGLEVGRRGILQLGVEQNDGGPTRVRLGGNAVRAMSGTLSV